MGETLGAEKFQIFQQAHQIAWQNSTHHWELNSEVYDCQGSHINSTKINGCGLKLAPKYKGPYKIISLKPHNNNEIAVPKQSHVIVNVNKLKPYHDDYKFHTFTDNLLKQGGDEEFDFPLTKKKLK